MTRDRLIETIDGGNYPEYKTIGKLLDRGELTLVLRRAGVKNKADMDRLEVYARQISKGRVEISYTYYPIYTTAEYAIEVLHIPTTVTFTAFPRKLAELCEMTGADEIVISVSKELYET